MRVGVYARVSTVDQNTENQLIELRRYCEARKWTVTQEFIDHGVSGSKESRPALNELMVAAKRPGFDALLVSRLDRLGRNLRHLILTLDELTALGIHFVSLGEGIDTSTPAGRLQLHVLGAIAEFERARIGERVRMGLARAKAEGRRLGRPRKVPLPLRSKLTVRQAAALWGVSKSTAALRMSKGEMPSDSVCSLP